MLKIEKVLDQQRRLITALLRERKKNNLLEMQNALYCMFLTDAQKEASDLYAMQLVGGKSNDPS